MVFSTTQVVYHSEERLWPLVCSCLGGFMGSPSTISCSNAGFTSSRDAYVLCALKRLHHVWSSNWSFTIATPTSVVSTVATPTPAVAVPPTPASSSAAPPTPHTAVVSQAPTPTPAAAAAAAAATTTTTTTPAEGWAAFPEQ